MVVSDEVELHACSTPSRGQFSDRDVIPTLTTFLASRHLILFLCGLHIQFLSLKTSRELTWILKASSLLTWAVLPWSKMEAFNE